MTPVTLLLLLLYYALHQDLWNWSQPRPLVFGFLPIGLFYHVLYTLGAALIMAMLVRVAWPADLEEWAEGREPEA